MLRARPLVIGCVVGLLGATASAPASAASALPANEDAGSILLVIDRPEIRFYQPYSGLQYRFRPNPLSQRGVRTARPRIILPKPAAPLIEYGRQVPHTSQFYSYCPDPPQPIEPREGPYGPRPVGPRSCP